MSLTQRALGGRGGRICTRNLIARVGSVDSSHKKRWYYYNTQKNGLFTFGCFIMKPKFISRVDAPKLD